jgi:ribosome-binding protein aMBF1 (putative translation factor)
MMITNERQYHVTKGAIREFEKSLEKLDNGDTDTRPEMKPIYRAAFESQILELQEQIAEYEGVRQGRVPVVETDELAGIGELLIKSRIAAGLTQRDLAERLGLKEQQIQRYESSEYQQAKLSRILEVADTLGIEFRAQVTLPVKAEA